jgi:hypothetical protein
LLERHNHEKGDITMARIMIGSFIAYFVVAWVVGAPTFAAENHTIIGTQDATWKAGDQESTTDGDPLIIEVAKGDSLEIQIPAGAVPHGFITITKPANQNPAETKDLVLACGDEEQSKPQAVLREVGCTGAPSVFGKVFTGTLKLEVSQKFQNDVNFWCVIHKKGMWGVIKLKASSK